MRLGVVSCCVALAPLIGSAAAGTPTVQELLAEEDQGLVNRMATRPADGEEAYP